MTIDRQLAFDVVAQIVCEYAATFGASGNPAPESERCLRHIELVASNWGYSVVKIREYVDLVADCNAFIYELESGHDC